MYGDRYEAYSAGVESTFVDPRAVEVLKEIGIDISSQWSKRSEELQGIMFDLAVTVCDKAKEACPVCGTHLVPPTRTPTAKEVIHKDFEDPAAASGSEEEQLNAFRRVRDEIKDWIAQTFGS